MAASEATLAASGRPSLRFVVREHDRIMETVEDVAWNEACHFCGAAPIVVVYRGWDDKVVTACKAHEEIVLEMIERDNA